ncbi:PQQ-dependent sugar dehydrogenase [Microbulbifer sp. ZKSA006]|uniref:PQQ-dependent sugar dehydrogenase n=1 Tax=Microbulbifer sp. ZKSA006 TaxID=3243390 RepID=UPI004039527C
MKYTLIFFIALATVLSAALAACNSGISVPWRQLLGGVKTTEKEVAGRLSAADGYSVQLFAGNVAGARWLSVTRSGDIIVSQPKLGQVSLLFKDRNGDGRSDGQKVLLDKLQRPHGLLLHDNWLYIAESDAIGRVAFDHSDGRLAGRYQRILENLGDDGHWTKTIAISPDGWLFLSSGSSCNICREKDPRRASIMRMKPNGHNFEIYATGLRNSVGFDWSPKDGGLYATDNGRDWLGDKLPPDELNLIRQGQFYGWPYAYGNRIPDPEFSAEASPKIQQKIADSIPPVHEFPAHNAPLGIRFLRSAEQPPDYRNAALVALHGSWNRSVKDGYKVVSLHWGDNGEIRQRDFLWGFLSEDRQAVYGRPVAIAEDNRGNIYISDDYAGAIYRVRQGAPRQTILAARQAPLQKITTAAAISTNAATVQLGAQLYRAHDCAHCHQAQFPLRNLSTKYTAQGLADYFDAPTPPMPNYNFTQVQKKALAHYLLSRQANR